MDGLSTGELEIAVEESAEPAVIRFYWRGRSAERTPGDQLRPYFARALDEAVARSLSLEMHFHALMHFNSATITVLIDLIQDAAARDVHLVLRYDGAVRWQRLSFDALRVFCRPGGLLTLTGA